MKEISSLQLETRDEVILRHVERYLRATNTKEEGLALRVHELLLARTPERARVATDFPLAPDLFHVQKEGGQKIRRWRNPEVSARPSIGVEEALVLAIGEPYRFQCVQELTQRLGGFYVPAPSTHAPEMKSAADLLKNVSDAIGAWAELSVDGINANDDPEKLRAGIAEINDVVADAMAMRKILEDALEAAEASRAGAQP